jgi:hypothetical protein
VIIDEFSMLRQKELHWVDLRLRQAKGNNEPFGGLTGVLSGDTAQLPPVKGNSLWARYAARSPDEFGNLKYVQYFDEDIELVEVERVDKNDKDAVTFLGFFNRLRDGDCDQGDWEYVCSQCSLDTMGVDEWKRCGFDNPNLIHLYTTAPPSLPKFIWVDFQTSYTGPSYFPDDPTRRGWVPVKSMVVEVSTHDSKKKDGCQLNPWWWRCLPMIPRRRMVGVDTLGACFLFV